MEHAVNAMFRLNRKTQAPASLRRRLAVEQHRAYPTRSVNDLPGQQVSSLENLQFAGPSRFRSVALPQEGPQRAIAAVTVLKRPTGWAEALSRSHAEARPAPPTGRPFQCRRAKVWVTKNPGCEGRAKLLATFTKGKRCASGAWTPNMLLFPGNSAIFVLTALSKPRQLALTLFNCCRNIRRLTARDVSCAARGTIRVLPVP
jgi:hypothetical protein